MAEIKTPVQQLPEGVAYTPGPDEYIVTEKHTIADIVRFAASFAGMDEVATIVQMEMEATNEDA